jgi:hypothetical protein
VVKQYDHPVTGMLKATLSGRNTDSPVRMSNWLCKNTRPKSQNRLGHTARGLLRKFVGLDSLLSLQCTRHNTVWCRPDQPTIKWQFARQLCNATWWHAATKYFSLIHRNRFCRWFCSYLLQTGALSLQLNIVALLHRYVYCPIVSCALQLYTTLTPGKN